AMRSPADQAAAIASLAGSARARTIAGSRIAAAAHTSPGASTPERTSGMSRWCAASYGDAIHSERAGVSEAVRTYGSVLASGVARINQIQPLIASPARWKAEGALAASAGQAPASPISAS